MFVPAKPYYSPIEDHGYSFLFLIHYAYTTIFYIISSESLLHPLHTDQEMVVFSLSEFVCTVLPENTSSHILTYGQTEAYLVHFKNKGLRSRLKIALFVENAVVGEFNLMVGCH